MKPKWLIIYPLQSLQYTLGTLINYQVSAEEEVLPLVKRRN